MLAAIHQETGGDWDAIGRVAGIIKGKGQYAGKPSNWHNLARQARGDERDEAVVVGLSADYAMR